MKFSHLVEHVSKKSIPPHVKHLIVEVMVSDEEGEDVEVCVFLFPVLRALNRPMTGSVHCYPNLMHHCAGRLYIDHLLLIAEYICPYHCRGAKKIVACVLYP